MYFILTNSDSIEPVIYIVIYDICVYIVIYDVCVYIDIYDVCVYIDIYIYIYICLIYVTSDQEDLVGTPVPNESAWLLRRSHGARQQERDNRRHPGLRGAVL